jgi:hypothetical protein
MLVTREATRMDTPDADAGSAVSARRGRLDVEAARRGRIARDMLSS